MKKIEIKDDTLTIEGYRNEAKDALYDFMNALVQLCIDMGVDKDTLFMCIDELYNEYKEVQK